MRVISSVGAYISIDQFPCCAIQIVPNRGWQTTVTGQILSATCSYE